MIMCIQRRYLFRKITAASGYLKISQGICMLYQPVILKYHAYGGCIDTSRIGL